jgi:hypothetical protein
VVLRPELLQDLQELKEVLPLGVIAAGPPARVVDKAALAELVHDGYLLRDLEGVFQDQVVKGVPFMGERPRGGCIPWLFEDGAVDGGPNLDPLVRLAMAADSRRGCGSMLPWVEQWPPPSQI